MKHKLWLVVIIFNGLFVWQSILQASVQNVKDNASEDKYSTSNIFEIWPSYFDEILERNWSDLIHFRLLGAFPRVNVQEMENQYLVEVDLPGARKNDITVKFVDDSLEISGEVKSKHENQKNKYLRFERINGKFLRVISLSRNTDKDKVTAELKDGVLSIAILKLSERVVHQDKLIVIK
jgi:HSP20 family molecular chaperone IbpA